MSTRLVYVATDHLRYLAHPTTGPSGNKSTRVEMVTPGTILDPALISPDQLEALVRKNFVRAYDVPLTTEGTTR